ncbi:MAG: redoxin domain-containing protein [Pedosphaera sp.]|nr:redoxin domain-containing protein [Pedosphaera sp.]
MTKSKMLILPAVALLAVALLACEKKTAAPTVLSVSVKPEPQTYQVRGVIQEIKPGGKIAVIKHEEIPDYMPAMTMPLDVKDAKELAGLKPGDAVTFRMIVTHDDGWIDQVQKVAGAPALTNAVAPPDKTFRRVPNVELLNIGDVVPDYKLTNQLGQPISLGQYKGQALAITFIFTRCPFPLFCPRMNEHFLAAQNQLQALPKGPKNWQLLSLSFDPENDTPAVLKNYASQRASDPARWTFATGDLFTIDGISEQFGLQFWRQDGSINHNLRTAVLDTKGRVQRIFAGNEWKPEELVAEMVKAAAVK